MAASEILQGMRAMRRRVGVAVLGGLMVGATASSATAGTPYSLDREVDNVRGWTIAANQSRNGCLAFATFKSETSIEIGFDGNKDRAFLLFANQAWDHLREGTTYDVKLVFDGHKRWNGSARAVGIGKLHALVFEGIKADFVLDFANYTTIQVDMNGRRLDGFNLAGTRAAVKSLVDCSQDMRAGRVSFADAAPPPPPPPPPAKSEPRPETPPAEPAKKGPSVSTGTGFFVNDKGQLVTNAHVVEDCTEASVKLPDGRTGPAKILARSAQNDLAVLAADLTPTAYARFRSGQQARLGDSIVLFGYPLAGELTVTGNLSTGLISAMAGPGEDVTRMQISAPVQSGNSGGAVVDQSGKVVGVVVAKANTRPRGDSGSVEVLQNVNFAIKAGVAGYFLDANQIPYTQEPFDGDKSTADVAGLAKNFTALVICRSR